MAKSFTPSEQGGTSQTHFLGEMHQPVTRWIAFVAFVLVREKRDLVTVHGMALRVSRSDVFLFPSPSHKAQFLLKHTNNLTYFSSFDRDQFKNTQRLLYVSN